MGLARFISASVVQNMLRTGALRKSNYKLVDCTSALIPRHYDATRKLYGKFDENVLRNTNSWKEYASCHIPGALHMDINIATYPGEYDQYSLYPPEIFQNYAQLLGINADDHLILYGRGPLFGVMFPSRIAWVFKAYGHKNVCVIDGGLAKWQEIGGEVDADIPKIEKGDWIAKGKSNCIVNFKELTHNDEHGMSLINNVNKINLIDCRPKGNFDGSVDCGFNREKVHGNHLKGAINIAAVDLFVDGTLKPIEEIKKLFISNGYKTGCPSVSLCMRGLQASVICLMLDEIDPVSDNFLYSGSYMEIERFSPEIICE